MITIVIPAYNEEVPIDPAVHQVFLCASPANIWAACFSHTWFVINDHGKLSRWEVFHDTGRESCADGGPEYQSWNHLYRDFKAPFAGLSVFVTMEYLRWRGRVAGKVEGELARRMAACIQDAPHTYPYCDKYSFLGPNSNTFTEWVIRQFPESGLRNPRTALGKGYRMR